MSRRGASFAGRPLLTAAVLVVLIANLVASTPPAGAVFPGANGKIAFSTGEGDIFVVDPDGSDLIQLTHSDAIDGFPAWSPDGRKIAFESAGDIYVMDADGTNVVRLTATPDVPDGQPAWSPDGTKIAFVRSYPKCGTETGPPHSCLWVMNADGTDPQRITGMPILEAESPDWSPDGTRIAFWGIFCDSFNPCSHVEIFTIRPDGTGLTRLTPGSVFDAFPSWSPDGTKIAFHGFVAFEADYDLFVMNPDGSGRVNLTDSPSVDEVEPTWSPDGTKIAFLYTDRFVFDNLFVMNADGSGARPITTPSARGYHELDWQSLSGPLPPRGGTITIVKKAIPTSGQDFTFGGDLGSFALDDDDDPTLSNTLTANNLAEGTYTVTEADVAGWSLTGLACNDPDGGTTTSLAGRTAVIDVDPGEFITCTFTNSASSIADLALTKSASSDVATVNHDLTYTLEVRNDGPDEARDVLLSDSLPAAARLVSWSATGGTCDGTATVICSLGSLSAGRTATVTIVVRPTEPGDLRNVATVTSSVPDPNDANNWARALTRGFNIEVPDVLKKQRVYKANLWLTFLEIMSAEALAFGERFPGDQCYFGVVDAAAALAKSKFLALTLTELATSVAAAPLEAMGLTIVTDPLAAMLLKFGAFMIKLSSSENVPTDVAIFVTELGVGYVLTKTAGKFIAAASTGTLSTALVKRLLQDDDVMFDSGMANNSGSRLGAPPTEVSVSLAYNPYSHFSTAVIRATCGRVYLVRYKVDKNGLLIGQPFIKPAP